MQNSVYINSPGMLGIDMTVVVILGVCWAQHDDLPIGLHRNELISSALEGKLRHCDHRSGDIALITATLANTLGRIGRVGKFEMTHVMAWYGMFMMHSVWS